MKQNKILQAYPPMIDTPKRRPCFRIRKLVFQADSRSKLSDEQLRLSLKRHVGIGVKYGRERRQQMRELRITKSYHPIETTHRTKKGYYFAITTEHDLSVTTVRPFGRSLEEWKRWSEAYVEWADSTPQY